MNQTREYWRALLDKRIPIKTEAAARNAAITATYASWYVERPHLCKWAGMAAFTSRQVGDLLRTNATPRWRALSDAVFGPALSLMRETNNAVFDDLGWAHLAFFSPDGGLAAVEEGLSDLSSHEELRDSFRLLEEARRAPRHAEALAWQAARAMLRHEQRHTVQPRFTQFPRSFRWWLTLTASGAFSVPGAPQPRKYFYPYMLRRGRVAPDLTRFEERWDWIDAEIIDLWRATDQRAPHALRIHMEQLRTSPAPQQAR